MTQIVEDNAFEAKDFGFIFPPKAVKFNQPYNKKYQQQLDSESGMKFENSSTGTDATNTFEIAATTQKQINLEECSLHVSGKLRSATVGSTRNWKCSNDWFLSFVKSATLKLSGVTIASCGKGNLYSNAFTALMHDRRDLIDGTLKHTGRQLNQYVPDSEIKVSGTNFTGLTYTTTGYTLTKAMGTSTGTPFYGWKSMVFVNTETVPVTTPTGGKNAISMVVTTNADGTQYKIDGTMNAVGGADATNGVVNYSNNIFTSYRATEGADKIFNSCIEDITTTLATDDVHFTVTIPLTYIFPSIVSLYPVFNQKIDLEICWEKSKIVGINNMNVATNIENNVNGNVEISTIKQFYLNVVGRELTSEAQQQSLQYYANGVQAEYTDLQMLSIPNITAEPNSSESLTASISVNYSPSLLIFCVPNLNKVQPYHTSAVKSYGATYDGTANNGVCFERFGGSFNSFTHLGLESLIISTTNGDKLREYNFKRNAHTLDATKTSNINKYFCYDGESSILDYQELYDDFREARKFFGRMDEGAISYDEFLKEYFMCCVDLTSFGLVKGTKISIDMQFAAVANKDYRKYGYATPASAIVAKKMEGGLLLLGRKLITYKGDSVSVSDIFVEGQSVIAPQ